MISAADQPTAAYQPCGYQMIKSLVIKNFRGFRDVAIDGLRRVNVVVGENSSGKTALLEAIFLAAGASPELAMRVRGWRGMEASPQGGSTSEQIWSALFGDLFYNFDMSRQVSIELIGTQNHTRSVTVSYTDPDKRITLPGRKIDSDSEEFEQTAITFRWKSPKGKTTTSRPKLIDNALKMAGGPEAIRASFYPANRAPSVYEVANRFSELSRSLRKQEFVDQLTNHFPEIVDISVESVVGAAALYAQVRSLPEKIPIGLASNGMAKLAALLLTMPSQPAGILLVDEIETGLYYQRMPKVWESLLSFAKRYDSQIFASTHSAECLLAAAQVAEHATDDFAVIRAVRESGESHLRHFKGSHFVDAVSEHIEVR